MTEDFDEALPDESVQLDQLQPDDTLIDRGVADSLDEGVAPPDHWSAGEGFGNTPAEMRQGESLDQRLAQEEPDTDDEVDPDNWDDDLGGVREVGDARAGRLVDANEGYSGEDTESDSVGFDVGISGGAASAEEAAVHIVEDL